MYNNGLGATIAVSQRGALAAKIAARVAARGTIPDRIKVLGRKVAPVIQRVPLAPPIAMPVLKLPAIQPVNVPPPILIATGQVPYAPSGGGQVTGGGGGAPSPAIQPVDATMNMEGPSFAGMSPVMMVVLAGLAATLLLKKR